MTPLKILHVVHEFAPFRQNTGGTGRYVYGLARAQAALGHSVTVLTQHQNPEANHLSHEKYRIDGKILVYRINITRFDQPEELYTRQDMTAFYEQFLSDSNFDLVHIHHFINLSGSVAECCEASGTPYGITFHDFWPFCIRFHMIDYDWQNHDCARLGHTLDDCIRCLHRCHFHQYALNNKVRQFLAAYLKKRNDYFSDIIEKASFVIGPSNFIKQIYDEHYKLPSGRFIVEPLGIEFHETAHENIDLPWVRFGYIGSIEKRKGVDLLLRVFKDLPYALHLWGNDPHEPDFQEYARTRNNLHYHGAYESPKDLPQIFSNIHLCIVPSLSESFGITARESLAHGVPVIASNWGGIPEAVDHLQNGLLFQVGDENALREAVQFAAGHPDRIMEMKMNTRKRLISTTEHARRLLSLYHKTLNAPAPLPLRED